MNEKRNVGVFNNYIGHKLYLAKFSLSPSRLPQSRHLFRPSGSTRGPYSTIFFSRSPVSAATLNPSAKCRAPASRFVALSVLRLTSCEMPRCSGGNSFAPSKLPLMKLSLPHSRAKRNFRSRCFLAFPCSPCAHFASLYALLSSSSSLVPRWWRIFAKKLARVIRKVCSLGSVPHNCPLCFIIGEVWCFRDD